MSGRVNRETVDLSGYPDLIVIYLGMRARTLPGVLTFFKFGRAIRQAAWMIQEIERS